MTFELIWALWHIPVEEGPSVPKLKNNEISFIFLRILIYLLFFYSFTVPQPFIVQYIYILYVWMCMCCRIHVLCTTWFVISPIQLQWTKLSPPNNKYKAQDPCFYLGLGTIKKKNPQDKYIYIYMYVCMYVCMGVIN